MKKLLLVVALALAAAGCARQDAIEIPTGSDVTLTKQDGVAVQGRLIEVKPEHVVIQTREGTPVTVPRAEIAKFQTVTVTPAPQPADQPHTAPAATAGEGSPAPGRSADSAAPSSTGSSESADSRPAPRFREVTLPAGTVLPVTLRTSVASDTSRVEDQVRGTIRRTVAAGGVPALPEGTTLIGHVTNAKQSARVKGRGEIAFRFTRADLPGSGEQMNIRTATVSRAARGTKKRDAATIGGGAVGGAIIGGIVGGADGAAKGAAIGGAGGTGVVLATRGEEVRLPAGTNISVRLAAPLTVRVPVR